MKNLVERAITELGFSISAIDPGEIDTACSIIAGANRIMLYGCGREALQLRGFAMRLHHLGLDVSMQGDMSAPPLGAGDLFIVSAGPGELSTATALMKVAEKAGADILFITAKPGTASARYASHVIAVPAQTMASDQGAMATSSLPMGSLYEGALFVMFEIMVSMLKERLGVDGGTMRANHTNME